VVVARRVVVVMHAGAVVAVGVVAVRAVDVVVIVMMVVRVDVGLRPRRLPEGDAADQDEDEQRDAAGQYPRVEGVRQDDVEHPVHVHQDRDDPERPTDEDGQKLFEVIIPDPVRVVVFVGVIVVVVIVPVVVVVGVIVSVVHD
jgi:hypothetical protein